MSRLMLMGVLLPRSVRAFSVGSARAVRGFGSTPLRSVYGVGMNQDDMMNFDKLIGVDKNDVINSSPSKREGHEFSPSQPRGILHRAFSVFLFNEKNELLITQRASTKITFPNVWTNTACSHPLTGFVPDEVDLPPAIADGSVSGIKHAARRKLEHELGISPDQVPHSDFRFLTRFHYWAGDTISYGGATPWGEHEVDYVLFIRKPESEITLALNDEEVSNVAYVSKAELIEMMEEEGRLWSPWFKLIMEKRGFVLWDDLDEALVEGGKHVRTNEILYFDPPKLFWPEWEGTEKVV